MQMQMQREGEEESEEGKERPSRRTGNLGLFLLKRDVNLSWYGQKRQGINQPAPSFLLVLSLFSSLLQLLDRGCVRSSRFRLSPEAKSGGKANGEYDLHCFFVQKEINRPRRNKAAFPAGSIKRVNMYTFGV